MQQKRLGGGEFYFFYEKKADFRSIFRLFTASFRSRPPGPPAVPGVFVKDIDLYHFTAFSVLFLNAIKLPV